MRKNNDKHWKGGNKGQTKGYHIMCEADWFYHLYHLMDHIENAKDCKVCNWYSRLSKNTKDTHDPSTRQKELIHADRTRIDPSIIGSTKRIEQSNKRNSNNTSG